jgi:uncharacterized membrane protein YeiH
MLTIALSGRILALIAIRAVPKFATEYATFAMVLDPSGLFIFSAWGTYVVSA